MSDGARRPEIFFLSILTRRSRRVESTYVRVVGRENPLEIIIFSDESYVFLENLVRLRFLTTEKSPVRSFARHSPGDSAGTRDEETRLMARVRCQCP